MPLITIATNHPYTHKPATYEYKKLSSITGKTDRTMVRMFPGPANSKKYLHSSSKNYLKNFAHPKPSGQIISSNLENDQVHLKVFDHF